MTKQETYQRVYNIVKTLRESGMSYDEIEDFWKQCIKEANENNPTKRNRQKA